MMNMMTKGFNTFTLDLLKEILEYNPLTGDFTWISTNDNHSSGDIANGKHSERYISINVNGKQYLAHRLAWFYTYGIWPPKDVDHIDGCRFNNKIANLRLVNRSENMQNVKVAPISNKSTGLLGASLHKRTGKFTAQIHINYKKIHLGVFNTPEEAHQAYLTAKRELHIACTI